jgi:hypothetical protein
VEKLEWAASQELGAEAVLARRQELWATAIAVAMVARETRCQGDELLG